MPMTSHIHRAIDLVCLSCHQHNIDGQCLTDCVVLEAQKELALIEEEQD